MPTYATPLAKLTSTTTTQTGNTSSAPSCFIPIPFWPLPTPPLKQAHISEIPLSNDLPALPAQAKARVSTFPQPETSVPGPFSLTQVASQDRRHLHISVGGNNVVGFRPKQLSVSLRRWRRGVRCVCRRHGRASSLGLGFLASFALLLANLLVLAVDLYAHEVR